MNGSVSSLPTSKAESRAYIEGSVTDKVRHTGSSLSYVRSETALPLTADVSLETFLDPSKLPFPSY